MTFEGKYMTFEQQGAIGILTLNRPEKMNVMSSKSNLEMMEIQHQIVRECFDSDLRAIIIRANGKHFSAGTDLEELKELTSDSLLRFGHYQQTVNTFWQSMPLPVIAAVQGVCIGGAFELVLAADIRIAAENARFSLPEVQCGLSSDLGGTPRLVQLIGPARTKMLLFSCDYLSVKDAYDWGVVQKVVPEDKLMDEAIALAERFLAQPPIALQMAKKSVNVAVESSTAASLFADEMQAIYCVGTEDSIEASSAFLEKRKPVFRGK